MSSPKLTILFLHGAYHPPACYAALTAQLEAAGLEVVAPRLASLGADARGTLEDDLAVVRTAAQGLFDSGKNVVIVAHSYGGFVAMNVAGSLTAAAAAREEKGGLVSIVYISGLLVSKGSIALVGCNPKLVGEGEPDLAEVFDVQIKDGLPVATLKDNERTRYYYHEPAPAEDVDRIVALLEPQCAAVFYIPSPVGPSDVRVRQTYISPEEDHAVLPEAQERAVAEGNMKVVKIPGCGHAPFLNNPQEVAGIIIETIGWE
ncbi:hypothetical protein TruAng_001994 [Truncatella angustata]|nr:hypothetical protein TruAng_001994 [Truncatella angustata]